MTKTMKQSIAVVAIIAQLLILLPFSIISVKAEESAPIDDSQPVLNETVVGTVTFQSFNFLGDNSTGEDATEYHTTFYYTDDFFSRSAINENANQQVMKWSDLEDVSMATCSMDFTLAAMTSSKGNVIRDSSTSWNNTDYSNKDSNVKAFLGDCGFTGIEVYGLNKKPTMDSIGYTIASKQIRVWDDEDNENKDYTVVAVGIRGAGYDSEWANNVKIGTQGNGANVVRHEGFDNSAKTVCASIEDYINRKHIDSNVKYWVTGFSRAAAVANLTAGYLTDGESIYHAAQKDIYGYTWECPQAASVNENALYYKNIHNIINPLDAVPKVSPTGFQHQRLGVDYQMPYHKNVSTSQNQTYYNRMCEVLKTVAVGSESGETDPLLDAVGNYPYNRTLPIYTITATQLAADALSGKIATNFGTVSASTGILGNVDSILGGNSWYMDDFIDNLIDVFLTSSAWDRGQTATTNVITHRTRFIDNYQEDFRVALGYMLDFSGPAFLGLVDKLISAVGQSLGISDAGMGLAFLNFYNDPKGSYASYNILVERNWRGKPKKDVLITESQGVVKDVVANMTSGYSHPTISRSRLNQALEKLTAVVVDLYADELDKYESQYFGTSLHWMNTILSTHEQETVLSWIMSLDPNHMNRSFRTLTVPKNTTVQLYEFRNELGETLSATGLAPVVAEFENGVQISSKDQRIYSEISGDEVTIRYPSSLDIRADIRSNGDVKDLAFNVQDYRTNGATTDVSKGETQYERLAATGVYTNMTSSTGAKNINAASDNYSVPMSTKDVLHIMTSGMSSYDDTSASYNVDKSVYVNTIAEGQFIHDGIEIPFQKLIKNNDGEEVEPAFLYTSTSGTDMSSDIEAAHIGRKFSVTLPEVQNGHFVEKYYITDATEDNDRQLSTDGDANLPSDSERIHSGSFTSLEYGQSDELKSILELEDTVFHVFYSGSPAVPTPITRIIDFNSKMILATDADQPEDISAENGSFELDDQNNATYQLRSGKLSGNNLTLTSVYSSVDSATIKGVFENESKRVKKKVTVVPASSIYFNDQLMEESIPIGNGSGYNTKLAGQIGTVISQSAQNVTGTFYYTFYGSGIDVYCTTHDKGGYISTALFKASQESECVKANREGTAKMIRNYSSEDYYNTPSISYTGLPARTYTLKIMANENAQYKLDGIRVYNSVEKNSAAEAELNKTGEANATYLNLRSVLLNDEGIGGFTVTNEILPGDVDPETVSGVLFIDDVGKIVTKSNIGSDGNTAETPVDLYQTQFDVYKGNGPKNEIYLDGGQALTFQLNVARFDENTKVYIGLSAPKTGNGSITINNKDISPAVTSVMDMYYPVGFDLNNAEDDSLSITLRNEGAKGSVISVTNLKITGIKDLIPASSNADTQETMKATRALFAPVTLKTIRMAANNGVDPEAETVESEEPAVTEDPEDPTVTEDPTETENPDDGSLVIDEPEETETPAPSVKPDTPAETGNTIQKVIQSITRSISSFFKSIFRR